METENVTDDIFGSLNILENTHTSSYLSLFLGLYAINLGSNPPKVIVNLFKKPFVKLVILILLAYYSSKNLGLSIIVGCVLMLILSQGRKYDIIQLSDKLLNDMSPKNRHLNRLLEESEEENLEDIEQDKCNKKDKDVDFDENIVDMMVKAENTYEEENQEENQEKLQKEPLAIDSLLEQEYAEVPSSNNIVSIDEDNVPDDDQNELDDGEAEQEELDDGEAEHEELDDGEVEPEVEQEAEQEVEQEAEQEVEPEAEQEVEQDDLLEVQVNSEKELNMEIKENETSIEAIPVGYSPANNYGSAKSTNKKVKNLKSINVQRRKKLKVVGLVDEIVNNYASLE